MKFKEVLEKLSDIEVFIMNDDIEIYHQFASALPNGSHILDLGTGWGKSALCLALSNPRASVMTIDNGEWQISRGWAKDTEDYVVKIAEQFKKHGAENILFVCGNVLELPTHENYFDLIHTDIFEAGLLPRWMSSLKQGGVLLVRNYVRHGIRPDMEDKLIAEVDKLCQGWKPVGRKGLIQVFRKPL